MKQLFSVLVIFLALFSCNDSDKQSVKIETIEEKQEMYNGVPISEKEPDNYTGEYLELYKNGLPKMKGHKVDGIRQGKWESWHVTGTKASEGTFINGKEDGLYTVYYENGNIRLKGKYKNGEKVESWKYFDENGRLTLDTIFKN